MVRIYCKNTGTYKGSLKDSLLDIAPAFEFDKPYDILAAKVNNVAEGLGFRVFHNRDVEFLDYRTYIGRNFYSRSLCFLLYKATRDLFPESRMTIRRPISKSYFCSVYKNDGSFLTEEDVEAIGARMGNSWTRIFRSNARNSRSRRPSRYSRNPATSTR